MLFWKNKEEEYTPNEELIEQLEHKNKYGFLAELQNSVRTDEEYAKFKGYLN